MRNRTDRKSKMVSAFIYSDDCPGFAARKKAWFTEGGPEKEMVIESSLSYRSLSGDWHGMKD